MKKKKLLTLFATLCMALMLCPVTASMRCLETTAVPSPSTDPEAPNSTKAPTRSQ